MRLRKVNDSPGVTQQASVSLEWNPAVLLQRRTQVPQGASPRAGPGRGSDRDCKGQRTSFKRASAGVLQLYGAALSSGGKRSGGKPQETAQANSRCEGNGQEESYGARGRPASPSCTSPRNSSGSGRSRFCSTAVPIADKRGSQSRQRAVIGNTVISSCESV